MEIFDPMRATSELGRSQNFLWPQFGRMTTSFKLCEIEFRELYDVLGVFRAVSGVTDLKAENHGFCSTQAALRCALMSQCRISHSVQMSSGPPVVQFSKRCSVAFRFVGPNGVTCNDPRVGGVA